MSSVIKGKIVTPSTVLKAAIVIENGKIVEIAPGVDNQTASLEAGKCADIAVLDKDYNCMATFVNGKMIHSN